MNNILVSVIIPTYNRAHTIERALDSVFAQTWPHLEVIVVDSASTDGTVERVQRYGDRVRVLREKKEGPGPARNAGIRAATGEIIAFLDSDDAWLPQKLERQVRLLQATGVQCCVCNAHMETASGRIKSFDAAGLKPAQPEGIWENPAPVLVTRFLFFNQVVAVRRVALELSGYFGREPMEDYDLALRLSTLGPWAYVAEPMVVWYEHGDNLTPRVNQLVICQRTFEILSDLSNSPRFASKLPQQLLQRRIRSMRQMIHALSLSQQTSAPNRFAGRALFFLLRVRDRIYHRLPLTPRMITRPV